MRISKKHAAAALIPLCGLPLAGEAAEVTIEVEAEVFSIYVGGQGELPLVEFVNGTGERLEIGTTVRAVYTYESDIEGMIQDGDPNAGDLGNYGFYGSLFSADPIVRVDYYVNDTLIQSTSFAPTTLQFVSVFDSETPETDDALELSVAFPDQPPAADNWGLRLVLRSGEIVGGALPDTLPDTGWRLFDAINDPVAWTWTWGVVTTPSTAAGHAEFDAYVTAIRINPDDPGQGPGTSPGDEEPDDGPGNEPPSGETPNDEADASNSSEDDDDSGQGPGGDTGNTGTGSAAGQGPGSGGNGSAVATPRGGSGSTGALGLLAMLAGLLLKRRRHA